MADDRKKAGDKMYGSREGYHEIGRGEGRTPAGRLHPELLRTRFHGFHIMWKGPLCWLAYLLLLAALGKDARSYWFSLTDGVVGAVGSLLPVIASFERGLPFMEQAERVPLLRHVWGGLWISQGLMLLVQCRYHGKNFMMFQSWQINEWNWRINLWWFLAAFISFFVSVWVGGGLFSIEFGAYKAHQFFVNRWVFSLFLCHLVFSIGANPTLFITITRIALLLLRLACPGRTNRWGYDKP